MKHVVTEERNDGEQIAINNSDDGRIQIIINDPAASKDAKEIGQTGGKAEADVIGQGAIYYGKEKGSVSVTMPLRDRNGESIAAARVIMRAFPGETENTAIARARPIVKEMQARIESLQDLME